MKWTPEQQRAILATGKDILVSAAAGSGKTAVLVERLIQKVTDEHDPFNIDELLVVTFTNAAAQEMRTRVGKAIEAALVENPASNHLKKQLSLLQDASITTLHSFCMEVIRKYSYLLEIDPAFRVADEMETDLLKQDILEDLLERWYGKEESELEHFYAVVDMFSSDRSDVEIENLILRLHDFSVQHPWPDQWLKEIVNVYKIPHQWREGDFPWLEMMKQEVINELEAMEQELSFAKNLTQVDGGPYHYLEVLEDDQRLIQEAKKLTHSWDQLQDFFSTNAFKRLPSKRVDCDKELRKEVQDFRNSYRKRWNQMKNEWFQRRLESHVEDLNQLQPVVETIVSLVRDFSASYEEMKREKALVDFNDLEHLCLELLIEGFTEEGRPIPSSVALDYQQQFKEIFIDEYQDTNVVQETILQLLRKPTKAGNLFMVGDVKQSIYRFRHAEPSLFIQKYNTFIQEDHPGERIDLSKNFRSRSMILDGVNFIFKQILNHELGEVDYDEEASLVYGNKEFTKTDSQSFFPELLIIDREDQKSEEAKKDPFYDEYQNLETAQLEARAYAKKIKQWIGLTDRKPLQVVDEETGNLRNIEYRDIVILQRSMTWAPVIVEEFKKQNIPIYAELSTGYFSAIEIQVMLSLLKIIDNPRQDIPFASVLRSPIIGLNEEELAQIRITDQTALFYEATCKYIQENNNELAEKLEEFVKQLENFRRLAREGALSELIWQIYRETGYYDFVGGIPGGRQRQANLRALYDRARFYEKTSFRGLFRFLRFIERMEERGDDLGAARALSEQEDVVRLMTIHRSKGLEFPVVIVGGMNREFYLRDLYEKYLLDKDIGLAAKFIDPVQRITYPTLYYHAVQKKKMRELLSEEMRILYVALTRAKEKLVMVGSVHSLEREWKSWLPFANDEQSLLPTYARVDARSYLDWIGPALIRHRDFPKKEEKIQPLKELYNHPSRWKIAFLHGSDLSKIATVNETNKELYKRSIEEWKPLDLDDDTLTKTVDKKLSFQYPYRIATETRAKQSVTELKRQREMIDEYSSKDFIESRTRPLFERPRFMQKEEKLTAAEYGTLIHTVMQHLPMNKPLTDEEVKEYIHMLVQREILTKDEAKEVDRRIIQHFYQTEIAQLMMEKEEIYRELPFSLSLPAEEIYPNEPSLKDEKVFIQGVIDCLIPEKEGWLLLDYKTDAIGKNVTESMKKKLIKRYETQMNLYRKAVESIWRAPVYKTYLYFFTNQLLLEVPGLEEDE